MSQIFLSPFAMPELDRVVEQLCAPSSLEGVFHRPLHDAPMPSLDVLGEILSRLKIALFPGYFGMSNVRMESMRYHLSANLDSIFRKLAEQIRWARALRARNTRRSALSASVSRGKRRLSSSSGFRTSGVCSPRTQGPPIRATRLRPARAKPFFATRPS